MRKIGFLVAGVAALGLALAQSNVIKIATMSPLSGPQAALGEQIKLGAELAVEEAKERFKALGFELVLVPYDNLVMVSPANTNPVVTDRKLPNVNRIVGRDDVQGPAAAEFVYNDLKLRRVFVIHDKTAYGQGLAEEFRKRFEALGGRVVAFIGTEEQSNFVPIINQIRAQNPQLVYFGGIYSQIGPFTKQLRERGLRMPLMGGDGLDSSEFERLAGSQNAKGAYYTTVAGPVSAFPQAKALAERFKAKYGKDIEGFGIYAYDAARVILAALENAIKANGGKKPTRAQVAQEVRKVKLEGITGTIEFDSKGDIKKAKYFVMQVAGTGNWADNKLIKVIEVAAPQK